MHTFAALALFALAFAIGAKADDKFLFGKYFGNDLVRNPHLKAARLEKIEQRLDHFNPTDNSTWTQYYLVSEGTSNISFIKISGENAMEQEFSGFWTTLANEVGAWQFELEHRFYGDSQPSDLSDYALRHLTSEQALADIAHFISKMNEKYDLGESPMWIAFGGSYAGALVAWLRNKYPHLVHAAVSSSGPVEAKLNFEEYKQVVASDLEYWGCAAEMTAAFAKLKTLVDNGDTSQLARILNLCDEITPDMLENPTHRAYFYQTASGAIDFIAQNNGILSINFDQVCYLMKSENLGDELDRYNYVIQFAKQYLTDSDCITFDYDGAVAGLKYYEVVNATKQGGRSWFYQTCVEFGYFQSSTINNDVFGDLIPVDLYTTMCKDVFGDAIDADFISEAVNHTNIMKGAKQIEVDNVLFVQGTHDPWHNLGLNESSDSAGEVVLVEGGSHLSDMYDPAVIDNEALQVARNRIRTVVQQWVATKK